MEDMEKMMKNAIGEALTEETNQLIEEKVEEVRNQLYRKQSEVVAELVSNMAVQQRADPANGKPEIVIKLR